MVQDVSSVPFPRASKEGWEVIRFKLLSPGL